MKGIFAWQILPKDVGTTPRTRKKERIAAPEAPSGRGDAFSRKARRYFYILPMSFQWKMSAALAEPLAASALAMARPWSYLPWGLA